MGSLTRGFLHFGAGLYTVEAELEAAAETEAEPTSDLFGGLGTTGTAEALSLIVNSAGSIVMAHWDILTLNFKGPYSQMS